MHRSNSGFLQSLYLSLFYQVIFVLYCLPLGICGLCTFHAWEMLRHLTVLLRMVSLLFCKEFCKEGRALRGWDFKLLLPSVKLKSVRDNLERRLLLIRQYLSVFADLKSINDQVGMLKFHGQSNPALSSVLYYFVYFCRVALNVYSVKNLVVEVFKFYINNVKNAICKFKTQFVRFSALVYCFFLGSG